MARRMETLDEVGDGPRGGRAGKRTRHEAKCIAAVLKRRHLLSRSALDGDAEEVFASHGEYQEIFAQHTDNWAAVKADLSTRSTSHQCLSFPIQSRTPSLPLGSNLAHVSDSSQPLLLLPLQSLPCRLI